MNTAAIAASRFTELDTAQITRENLINRISRLTAWTVAAVGLLVLIGWEFDIATLISVVPGFATMKANTAFGFMLIGTGSALLHNADSHHTGRLARFCSAMVVLLGMLTLAEYVVGWDLRIDTLLFRDRADTTGSLYPNRMSPGSAFNFVLIGVAQLLLIARSKVVWRIAHILLMLAFTVSIIALMGYLYSAPALYRLSIYSSMAVHTALFFGLISVSGLMSPPIRGVAALLIDNDIGATLIRRMLPIAIFVLPFIGYLQLLGRRHGLYSTEFGLALYVTTSMIVFTAMILSTARSVRNIDKKRREVEVAWRVDEERITNLVDNIPDYAILMLDPEGRVKSWNRGAERLKGYEASEILGQHFSRFYTPEDIAQDIPGLKLKRAVELGKYQDEGWRVRKDGSRFWADMIISPMYDAAGNLIGFTKITRDSTERNLVDAENRKHEQRLLLITNHLSEGLVIADMGGQLLHWNEASKEMFGFQTAEEMQRNISDFVDTFELSTLDGTILRVEEWPFARVIGGERLTNLELRLLRIGLNRHFVLSFSGAIVKGTDGTELAFLSFIDATERKRIENVLERTNHRFAIASEAAGHGFWDFDIRSNTLQWDDQMFRLYGRSPLDGLQPYALWADSLHAEDRARSERELTDAINGASLFHPEFRIVLPNGEIRYIKASARVIRDEDGRAVEMIGVNFDITEQKRTEAILRESHTTLEQRVRERTSELSTMLNERELLLQEVHHRVKNNLQIISSLINMQIRQLTDKAGRSALGECRSRVESIALIHEKLYQSKDYANVQFSEYARTLAIDIFHAAGISPGNIKLRINIDPILLMIDKAIPCGLILNELITNSLKHAFPDDRSGSITVALRKLNGSILLAVTDDGIGLRDDFDIETSKSLGMQLVATLAAQLSGQFDITQRGGTTVSVLFPMSRLC